MFQRRVGDQYKRFYYILRKLYLLDVIVLSGNLLHPWDKGEEAVTKGEAGTKRGNNEFNFRWSRVSSPTRILKKLVGDGNLHLFLQCINAFIHSLNKALANAYERLHCAKHGGWMGWAVNKIDVISVFMIDVFSTPISRVENRGLL